MIASGAEAVVKFGAREPSAEFIRLAHERGFNPHFSLMSFAGADELARRLSSFSDITVVKSQVVRPPEVPNPPSL